MAKDNKGMNPWLVVVIAVVAYVLISGGSIPGLGGGKEPTVPQDGTCGVEDISFTPKITRLGKAGTALGAAENYFILTDSLGSAAASAATTVGTDYDMEVMFGENSTSYYTKVETINTDCQDPFYKSVSLAYADTSLATFYAENSDGTVNGATNKEPLGSDDSIELAVYMKASSDEYFGNPDSTCDNIAVIEYDKTYIKSVTSDTMDSVPGFFTYSNTSIFDGSSAFVIPKTADGEKVSVNVKMESTSTDFTGTNYPILYIYDCNIDKNEDTLGLIHGVEDEDQNSLSLAGQTKTIYLS